MNIKSTRPLPQSQPPEKRLVGVPVVSLQSYTYLWDTVYLIIDTLLQSRNLTLNMGDFNNK